MPFIEIRNLWTDSDDMIQLEFMASNDIQVSKQDFYIYPDDLLEFGSKLQVFPRSLEDVASLEYGENKNFYCYFLLRAFVIDSAGHSALEVKFDNRLKPPEKTTSNFFMLSEPANINDLGKGLCSWVKNMSKEYRHEWKIT